MKSSVKLCVLCLSILLCLMSGGCAPKTAGQKAVEAGWTPAQAGMTPAQVVQKLTAMRQAHTGPSGPAHQSPLVQQPGAPGAVPGPAPAGVH